MDYDTFFNCRQVPLALSNCCKSERTFRYEVLVALSKTHVKVKVIAIFETESIRIMVE